MLKNKILILAFSFFCIGCHSPNEKQEFTLNIDQELLCTGDIICRLGNGYFSKYFREYASREKKYSHIGILSIENGVAYVYHSEASELTGVGLVKKETLNYFLSDIYIYEFYRMNYSTSIISKITNNVKIYYQRKTPFDLDFDSYNDNELYCAELIAVSINSAFKKVVIEPTLMLNNQLLYGLDDIYLNENFSKISFQDSLRISI